MFRGATALYRNFENLMNFVNLFYLTLILEMSENNISVGTCSAHCAVECVVKYPKHFNIPVISSSWLFLNPSASRTGFVDFIIPAVSHSVVNNIAMQRTEFKLSISSRFSVTIQSCLRRKNKNLFNASIVKN